MVRVDLALEVEPAPGGQLVEVPGDRGDQPGRSQPETPLVDHRLRRLERRP